MGRLLVLRADFGWLGSVEADHLADEDEAREPGVLGG
jgi:hypothetical protein